MRNNNAANNAHKLKNRHDASKSPVAAEKASLDATKAKEGLIIAEVDKLDTPGAESP